MNRINYDQEKIIELYNKGYTDRQIAETLNYPVNNFASYRRKNLKLPPNKPRETDILTADELAILIGTLLGDSCVQYVHSKCKYPSLSFTHCIKQKEYFLVKCKKLEKLISSYKEYNYRERATSKDKTFLHCTGKNMKCLVDIRNVFYPDGIKIIPIEFLEKHMTKESIYYLMMDDGSYDIHTNSYILNTQCFTRENLENFIEFLKVKFGLDFSVKSDNSLYLKHSSNEKMVEILQKYNICDSMNYKCCLKTPLNGEVPDNLGNPVLNPQEIEENAERLEVMPNTKGEAIKSSTKAGHYLK